MIPPEVNDLRLLKLAVLLESAHAAFALKVAAQLAREDPQAEEALLRMAAASAERQARLAADLRRLSVRADPALGPEAAEAALMALRDFYKENADRLHDPAAARLFQELYREERRHLAV